MTIRILALLLVPMSTSIAADDIIVANFEGDTYGDWKTTGEAFGKGPAKGTLPNQMEVTGFLGKGLVNSYHQGDTSTGTLTSPSFKVERKFINFLIGGGHHPGETCINLLVDGKVVRTETGPNSDPGGTERLDWASWNVEEFAGKLASIQIVDTHTGGWGHINVDQIVQSETRKAAPLVPLDKSLPVNGTHLIIPVANGGRSVRIVIHDGDKLIQNFDVALPRGDEPFWLVAYPLEHFGLRGKTIRLAGAKVSEAALAAIKVGAASDVLKDDDYKQPYRDQFHMTTRRGWNNDPNGMVYHNGKYHVYYQHNPFGIGWGNMHWGHFESTDLIHWQEQPIALFQKTVGDMMFSGGGFVDKDNTSGLGKDTLFVAFTSTGRGECLAYSRDGGRSFAELEQNPVVKHNGRDPKVIWYAPEKKWVMVVFDDSECAETKATPPSRTSPADRARTNIAFYESKNLRQWTRTGAFTDPDRMAVFECPEMFELPIVDKQNETRWILSGAQNRYFIGRFNGKTFIKESGPHGGSRGRLYAAQTFSDTPDGRRIQIGWIRTDAFTKRHPAQIVSQAFSVPQEMILKETVDGLRVLLQPVRELETLRGERLAVSVDGLKECRDKTTEVLIEFTESGKHELTINGIDASFTGRSARILTDRTFNEIFVDGGLGYTAYARKPVDADLTETVVKSGGVKSLQIFRLKPIW